MATKITKDEIYSNIKNGASVLGDLAIRIYGETLDQAGKNAFSEAIEIGIENTIACLYDANVDDRIIIRVVIDQWGLDRSEIEDRIVWEKGQAAIRALKQYLVLQGYSSQEIKNFMITTRAGNKIRHNAKLWTLKDTPQKLVKAVQE